MLLTEIRYLQIISSRLRNFVRKSDRLWNCSCPICGDSKKDKRKARGYFFVHDEHVLYKCHNCGVATSFSAFLQRFDLTEYENFRRELLEEKFGVRKKRQTDDNALIKQHTSTSHDIAHVIAANRVKCQLTPFENMPQQWKQYLLSRKIPLSALQKYFFYTERFKHFANWFTQSDKYPAESLVYEESRIVIVFHQKDGTINAIQGRETTKSYAKYVTIKASEQHTRVFGLDAVDQTQRVYVVEGPIDSLFIDNAVAAAGADLVTATNDVITGERVFIFDNEPRSSIIVKKIEQTIDQGHSVVIFPSTVREKDINDMVLAGHDVNAIIRERTFSGLRAKAELQFWKK